jgi:ERCC4-related helicase
MINTDEIIETYGKEYFDNLYNETKQTKYDYKLLLKRSDFTNNMALKLSINKTLLLLEAYYTKNNVLLELLLENFKKYNLNHILLFNEAIKNDDIELLKISNKISKIPNTFVSQYTYINRTHYILDLVANKKANNCYTYMKNELKLYIDNPVCYLKFPIRLSTDFSDYYLQINNNKSYEGYEY